MTIRRHYDIIGTVANQVVQLVCRYKRHRGNMKRDESGEYYERTEVKQPYQPSAHNTCLNGVQCCFESIDIVFCAGEVAVGGGI